MANRSYLAVTQSGDPNDKPLAETILVTASYCYPILWWSIFDSIDITTRTEDWEDEDENPVSVEVPTLITTPAQAIQSTRDKSVHFFAYFPVTYELYYRQWLALLEGLDAPYIQLFTDEIAMMSDPVRTPSGIERYEGEFQRVQTYVRAFAEGQPEDWAQLLAQVQITLDRDSRRLRYFQSEYNSHKGFVYQDLTDTEIKEIAGYRLRGHSWEREVPWEED